MPVRRPCRFHSIPNKTMSVENDICGNIVYSYRYSLNGQAFMNLFQVAQQPPTTPTPASPLTLTHTHTPTHTHALIHTHTHTQTHIIFTRNLVARRNFNALESKNTLLERLKKVLIIGCVNLHHCVEVRAQIKAIYIFSDFVEFNARKLGKCTTNIFEFFFLQIFRIFVFTS